MIQDVMAPVVQGTLHAIAAANQVRALMLQEQQVRQAMAAEERRARVEDIRTRMDLERAGRQLVGGAVAVDVPAPTLPGIPGVLPPQEQAPIQTMRPAVPEQVVKWKDLAGVERQYELRSEREQIDEAILRRVQEAKALQEAQRVQIPSGRPGEFVDPRSLNYLLGLQRQTATEERAEADRRSRETIAAENRASADKRAREAVASREKIAGMKTTGRTPGQEDTQARFAERERKRTEDRIIKLDQELLAAHQTAQRLGEISDPKRETKKFVDEAGKVQPMNDLIRARYGQKAKEAKAKAQQIEAERNRLARSIGWRETGQSPAAGQGGQGEAGQNPYR